MKTDPQIIARTEAPFRDHKTRGKAEMRTPVSSVLAVGGHQGTETLTHRWEPRGQGDLLPVHPCHSRALGSQHRGQIMSR